MEAKVTIGVIGMGVMGYTAYDAYTRAKDAAKAQEEAAKRKKERAERVAKHFEEKSARHARGESGQDQQASREFLARYEALQDLIDVELWALRRTAERECAATLLALPVLGGDEGPNALVVAALILLGEKEAWERLVVDPFFTQCTAANSPLPPDSLHMLGFALAQLSPRSAHLVNRWLRDCMECCRRRWPGISACEATIKLSSGITLTLFDNVLKLILNPKPMIVELEVRQALSGPALQELSELGFSVVQIPTGTSYSIFHVEGVDVLSLTAGKERFNVSGPCLLSIANYYIRNGFGFGNFKESSSGTSYSTEPEMLYAASRSSAGPAYYNRNLRQVTCVLPPTVSVSRVRCLALAKGELSRRARAALRRVGDKGAILRGAGFEHCQALSGDLHMAFTSFHTGDGEDAAATPLDVNVLDDMREADAALIEKPCTAPAVEKELLRKVPRPGRDEHPADSGAEYTTAGAAAALKLEVAQFVPAMLQLTRALLVQTPVNADGNVPAELCVHETRGSVTHEAQRVFFVPTSGSCYELKVRLKDAARERDARAQPMAQPPTWWAPTFAAIAVIALRFLWYITASSITMLPALFSRYWPTAMCVAVRAVLVLAAARSLLLAIAGPDPSPGGVGWEDVWRRRWKAASRHAYIFMCPYLGWKVPILRDVAELRGKCRATLGRWSARLAAQQMREAVSRGRIKAADLLMLMDKLCTAAEWATTSFSSSSSYAAADAVVEVVLPGTEREAEDFLDLWVTEDEGEENPEEAEGDGGNDRVRSSGGDAGARTNNLAEVNPPTCGRQAGRHGGGLLSGVQTRVRAARSLGRQLGVPTAGLADVVDAAMSFEAPRRPAHAVLGAGDVHQGEDEDEGTGDEDGDEPAAFAADGRAVAVAAWAGQKAAGGRRSVKDLLKVNGWTLHRRGKHLVYKRRRGDGHGGSGGAGSSQTLVMAATPSDRRAASNTMAQMHRLNDDDRGGLGSGGGTGGSGSGSGEGGGEGDRGGGGGGGATNHPGKKGKRSRGKRK